MIRVDPELTVRLSQARTEDGGTHSDVGHFMRSTGIKAVVLPDGTRALGWDHGMGTWGILTRTGGLDLPAGTGEEWFAARVEPEAGQGFTTSTPRTLWESMREALLMPCPILEDGHVIDGYVRDAVDAEELKASRDAAPAMGM